MNACVCQDVALVCYTEQVTVLALHSLRNQRPVHLLALDLLQDKWQDICYAFANETSDKKNLPDQGQF